MVTPSSAYLEVLRRQPLSPKPQGPHELQRRSVAWLDVGFNTMKTMHPKRPPDNRPDTFLHQALTCMAGVSIEAQVCRLKHTADDLTQVDHANELVGIATPEKVRDEIVSVSAQQVVAPALLGR